jgi:hypothetical protein
VNILDANVPVPERDKLRAWKVPCRRIGEELAQPDAADADLLSLFHRMGKVTFFTRDRDFWRAALCHPAYCLVYLDVPVLRTADFIRAFLRHPQFKTQATRLGKVVHAHEQGITVFSRLRTPTRTVPWLKIV